MPTVNLRVWAANQINQAQPTDRLEAIIAEVVRIWGKAGVTLVPEAPPRAVHLKRPVAAALGVQPIDLAVTVPAELAAVINPAIAEKREGWVDVVFVPAFGHWGQAYSPLTQLSPGKWNSFAPFTGPVVIVATRAAQRPAQPETTRANAATPRDAAQTAEQLLEIALANDVAHELGHVFGLWHTSDVNRPGAPAVKQAVRDAQHLIYKTLYVEAVKAANRTPAGAQAAINADPAERTALTVAVAGEWFIVLRGEVVDAADITVVHTNIDTKRVWTQ